MNGTSAPKKIKVITAAVLALMLCLVMLFAGCKKEKDYLLKVDGEEITERQFKFFCSLVLEDEAFTHAAFYDTDNNFTEAVKNEAKLFAQEYIARYHEATNAGFAVTDEEKADVLAKADEDLATYQNDYGLRMTEEEYYDFFYGITKEEYLSFREKWKVIDDYNDYRYEAADTSEEAQRATYEKYRGFLETTLTSLIIFRTEDKTTDEKQNAKKFAELILNRAKNGEDFDALMKQYSEDTEFTEESNGQINISRSFEPIYPNLYKWAAEANPGDIAMITESDGYYIAKCISTVCFDDIVNTDQMIEYTRFDRVQVEIDGLLSSKKYEIDRNDELYDSCDISDLISQAIEYWTALWEQFGFPAT
jgi:foldase protein PrsA